MSLARRRVVQIIGTFLYLIVGLRLLHFKHNFQMPHCIRPPAKGLALRPGDPRHARVASGVIKSLGERTTQRLRIACWYDVDQTRDSQPREIGPAGAIGAYERKSASKGLTLYDGKAFLTGRKHKNVGRSIEILKLAIGEQGRDERIAGDLETGRQAKLPHGSAEPPPLPRLL